MAPALMLAVPVIAAKVESFFVRWVPWQLGQSGAGPDERTSFSNSFPHEPQAYSYIGMMLIPICH